MGRAAINLPVGRPSGKCGPDTYREVVSVLSGVPRETRFERDQMFEPSTFDRGDLKEVQSKFRAMEFESISS